MCDRSQEFFNFAIQINHDTKKNIKSFHSKTVSYETPKTKTAFNEAAGEIARGVHKTSTLLTKLTNLVRRQGLFDDPTEEINNLILRIKQDLDELNSKCDSAQQYIESKQSIFSSDKNHSTSHNVKVVSHLKTDLMHTTKEFKTVLEMRSSKMKDQQIRKVELIGKSLLSPMRNIESSSHSKNSNLHMKSSTNNTTTTMTRTHNSKMISSPSPYTQTHNPYNAAIQSLHSNTSENNNNNNRLSNVTEQLQYEQQTLLLDPIAETQYFESREKAVTEVERTIGELGQLFNRLATMISSQNEMIERVDDDVEMAVSNANKAQDVLMKAYEKVSSNRAMYMKIFAILGVFALFFILFLM